MNILTWINSTNNGAFQKLVNNKIFSDALSVKPTFSFVFTDLQYIEQNKTFKVDGKVMTAEQKSEILAYINSVVPPIEWNKAVKRQEIEIKHQEAIKLIAGNVQLTEIATWRKQEEQARAWNVDNLASTPMLDGLLAGRAIAGETKQMLVDKIIANADGYETAYAPVLGKYQARMNAIEAATTATEVDAIIW